MQRVGSGTRPFQNEAEYLNFLSNDTDSKLLWVDHQDWQVIANVYQMKIHILTDGVQGMEEPKARWTHLDPDNRLESFKNIDVNIYGDMWVLHEDSMHFDLIIRKNSILSQKDGVFHKAVEETRNEDNLKGDVDNDEVVGPGYMGWKM